MKERRKAYRLHRDGEKEIIILFYVDVDFAGTRNHMYYWKKVLILISLI